ncbi:phage tail protein [Ectopseudomonas guguanensis]|uniref:phage tail protein n=1 Tax=Ectopseudomonas guguanensis TaxID=1198456 RepID=UPI00285F71BB|nr:phage tail protein [Pseudomonas guguanensis]MDR8014094.1 phage tail protein [Pseudomonas guguanensis]
MMMALGMFVFGMHTLAYQEFQRQNEWRHNSTSRIGARPARQYTGPGDETITLPGVLLPEIAGSTLSLDTLRVMADTGKAWPLIEGTGRIYGIYVIENMSETRTYFFSDGAARRIEFSLVLKRVDESRVDLLGSLTGALGDVLRRVL